MGRPVVLDILVAGFLDAVGVADEAKIVYRKDRKRCQRYDGPVSFTFPGYAFRARKVPTRDGTSMFAAFFPAVSKDALKEMSAEARSWSIHHRTAADLEDIAAWINPVVRGWMTCYGRFCRTEMNALLRRINACLVRWARRKYKRLGTFSKARRWRSWVCPIHRRNRARGTGVAAAAQRGSQAGVPGPVRRQR
jgi:hypothetical protein